MGIGERLPRHRPPNLSSSGGAPAASRGPIARRSLTEQDRARQPLRLYLEHQHALPDGSPGAGLGCADPGPEDDRLGALGGDRSRRKVPWNAATARGINIRDPAG